MIPDGWSEQRIVDVLERVANPVDVIGDELYQQIGIRSHAKGLFDKEYVTGESLGNKRVFWVVPDCFIVNIVFAWEQAIGKTTNADIGKIASHRFPMYQPKDKKADVDFFLCFFKSKYGKHLLTLASPGGAGRNKTLGQKEFGKTIICLPPQPEQKKIAKILSTWDKAIATTEKLIENAKDQKKALMQQLLTGKKRFPEFNDDWTSEKLGNIATFRRGSFPQPYGKPEWFDEKNGTPFIQVFDIDTNMSLKPRTKKRISQLAAPNSVYIPKGTIIVSIQGSIGRVAITQYDAYVDRTVLLFQTFKKQMDSSFFAFSLQVLFAEEKKRAPGGTIKTITKQVLSNFTIPLSIIEEQREISNTIDIAAKEIINLENQFTSLQEQKKALMQQLLTGKRRVKIDGGT